MIRRRSFARLKILCLAIGVLQTGVATADWKFDPILRAAWDYDDNATLSGRTDEEIELSGYIAEASVDLVRESERGFFSLRPMYRGRNYGSDSERNADDAFVRLLSLFDGDKNSFRILVDASSEAVRTAELADAALDTNIDPNEIDDDQSGFVNDQSGTVSVRERRERYRVNPSWEYQISDISTFTTNFNYLTVSYDEQEDPITLFDFTDARLRFAFRRRFSPRNIVVLSLSGRDFDTDRFGGDRSTYDLMAGFERRLSETTQFRALFGAEAIEQEDVGQVSVDTEVKPVVDISLTRRLKTIHLLAQYRQRVNATGRGELTQRDEINLRFTRDLNDRFSAGLGFRAYADRTVSGPDREQNYVQLRGQVIWRISRSFFLQGDYRYSVIDRDTIEGAANSNRLTIWLSYRPNEVRRDPRMGFRF